MRAINLKTNHLTAPVGIDAGPLFLSWQCADGVRQTAYEIEVTANNKTVWQSGKVQKQCHARRYPRRGRFSRARCMERSVCGMKTMSPAHGVRHALRPALHSATG